MMELGDCNKCMALLLCLCCSSHRWKMYIGSGVDDDGSWLHVMKEHGLVKVGGAWYTLKYGDEVLKFQSKEWSEMLKKDEFRKYCYDMICDKVILKYTKADLGIDDVEITEEVLGD